MRDGTEARIGHLFPHLDLLPPDSRLRLSELLAVPGAAPALLPDEIADLPLPQDAGARRALRAAIEAGLAPDILARMTGFRLAQVVPPIAGPAGALATLDCPARLRQVLRRQAPGTLAALGALTLGEIGSWTNVGPLTLATLVGMAVEAGLTLLAGEPEAEPASTDPSDVPPVAEAADLAVLLDHDGGELRALLDRAVEHESAVVSAAAARLLASAHACQKGDPRVALLGQVWARTGGHRDRGVLAHRALRLDRRLTTTELAPPLGLSATRVGQIEARARNAVAGAVAQAPAALRQLAADVSRRLGPVTTRTSVDDLLASWRLPPSDDPRSMVLLWVAGPYDPVAAQPGWLATDPASLLADTRRALHDDGGVRPMDQVRADLQRAGVAAELVDGWLAGQPVTIVHGLVVARTGTPADVAERVLSATGRAMTPAELVATLGPDASAVLEDRLRRDRRFVRVSADHFELTEWGSAAFEPPGSGSAAPAPELFPGVGRAAAAAQGTWWLRVEVDSAVLRGTSGPVPVPLVEALGVARGASRTFTTRYGPVAIVHRTTEPTRGSVRPVALGTGARAGDTLVLGFDAIKGAASVELVSAAAAAT